MIRLAHIPSLPALGAALILAISCQGRGPIDIKVVGSHVAYLQYGEDDAEITVRTTPVGLFRREGVELSLEGDQGLDRVCRVRETRRTGLRRWRVTVKVVDPEQATCSFRFMASDGRKTGLSGPVTIKRVLLGLRYVSIGGAAAAFDDDDDTWTAILPTVTDFSHTVLEFQTDAESVSIDGRAIRSGDIIDFSSERTIRTSFGPYSKEFRASVHNTGLPIVHISTPDGLPVTSKEEWMQGAAIWIEQCDGSADYEGSMGIKGRGNASWTYEKKPYAIKLDHKAGILGMPEGKRWVLLANWVDRTLLRNDAALWLSRHSGLPYTVRGQFVELVLNGEHQGNYYLCEQIRVGKDRVDITEMEPQKKDPEKLTGGYLLQIDGYFDEPRKFVSPIFGLPYGFKYPDAEDLSPEAETWFKSYVTELETILKDEKRVKAHEYEAYLDVDSSIEYMLVQEVTGNSDFHRPKDGLANSIYLYKDRGGKLYFGPAWDFDYNTFMPAFATRWTGAPMTLYYPALLKDEKYRQRILEIWKERKEVYAQLSDYIDRMAEHIRVSESINHKLWPLDIGGNWDELLTFDEAIGQMKSGLKTKIEWMDAHIRDLGQ